MSKSASLWVTAAAIGVAVCSSGPVALAQDNVPAPRPAVRPLTVDPMRSGVTWRDGATIRSARTDVGMSSHPAYHGPAIWQGLSVGLTGTFTDARFAADGLDTGISRTWQGGANLGWTWQQGAYVVGLVGDIDIGRRSALAAASSGIAARAETDWSATLRVKAGLAIGDWLPYATVGVATIQPKLSIEGTTTTSTPLLAGLTYGAGLAWKATPNVSVSGEVLRTQYQDGEIAGFKLDPSDTRIRVGVTWHFN